MHKILFPVIAALTLGACSGDKRPKADKPAAVEAAQETAAMSIKGALSYRERIALRPGLTAKITLSDISSADRKAPVLASVEYELRGKQVPLPFEFIVGRDQVKPAGRYSVRGTLTGPEGALLWMTDTAHIINTEKIKQDLGELLLVRTEARRRTQIDFYQCGKIEVETRLSDGNMTIVIDGEEANLPRVPSASGVKYQTRSGADKIKIMFWKKGEGALLQVGAKTYPECVMMDLK